MNYKALFLASLAINVAVGFYAIRKSRSVSEAPRKETSTGSEAGIAELAVKVTEPTATNTVINRFNWESVESPDYKQYIANLRSVGCPEETIRDIIRADMTKLYEEKKKQVRKEAPKWEYWKGAEEFVRGVGREAWMKMLALNEERDAALGALGIQPDSSKRVAKDSTWMDWMLDPLGDEKKAQILRLRKELDDRLALRAENSLDGRGIELLIKERDDAVKRLLTPEEALQYELRMSTTAGSLRSKTFALEPTEEEFVALFKLRKEYTDKLDEFPMVNPDTLSAAERRAKREAAEAVERQLLEAIKQTLGPERYADYQAAQDPIYQQMYRLAKQVGLGAPEAKQIYERKRFAEEQASRIRDDANLTPEKQRDALASIRQETERSIQAALGENGWEQYNRGRNHQWLDAIDRRSGQPNTAAPRP